MTEYGTRTGITGKLLYEETGDERLIGVEDSNDRPVIWYEYDVNDDSLISAVQDNVGREVKYTYTNGLLANVSVVMSEDLSYDTQFEYDGEGRITNITFPEEREDNVTYGGSNSVVSVVDSRGIGTFMQYDYDKTSKEYYAQLRTSSGMIKEIIYDRDGETKQVDINGRTTKKVVRDGRDLIITDEKGNVTREEYDEWENLTRKVYPDDSKEIFEYEHVFNRVTKHTDQNGNVTTYEYNEVGDMTRKKEAAGTASEIVTTYTYDANSTTVTIEEDANTTAATTTYVYDANGNVASITDPEGNMTEYLAYDNMGNVLQKRGPRGNIWTYVYDDKGRLTSEMDPLGNTTAYEYDGEDRSIAVVNPYMKRFEFQFDESGNVKRATDPYDNYTATEYNTDNLPVRIIDQSGNEFSFEYDNEMRLLKVIDGTGNDITFVFDESQQTYVSSKTPWQIEYPTYTKKLYFDRLQRITSETTILDEETSYSVSYGYDPVGNRISETDQEGKGNGVKSLDLTKEQHGN